jgi:LacI family transcriptional regulator
MAQPCFEIGRQAMQLLLARIAEPGIPHQTIRLDATFVHRESCGCPHQGSGVLDRTPTTSGGHQQKEGRITKAATT